VLVVYIGIVFSVLTVMAVCIQQKRIVCNCSVFQLSVGLVPELIKQPGAHESDECTIAEGHVSVVTNSTKLY
jgi:hypothetical protein